MASNSVVVERCAVRVAITNRTPPYIYNPEFDYLVRVFGRAENEEEKTEMENGVCVGRTRTGTFIIYADNGMTARRAIASALRSFCPDIIDKENNKNNGP